MPTKLKRIIKVLSIGCVILALLIAASAVAVLWHASLMPVDTYVPTPAIPSPNARDYFKRAEAIAHEEEPQAVAEGTPQPIETKDEAKEASELTSFYHVFTLGELDKLVAQNARAMDILRKGLKFPYMATPIRSFDYEPREYAKGRSMARLLGLESKTRAAHGDWGAAMASSIDAIEFGSDLSHGGGLIGLEAGTGCQGIGRYRAYAAIDHLTSAEAIAAVRRLAKIDANQEPFTQAVREEEWSTQASLLQLFGERGWRRSSMLESPQTVFDASNLLNEPMERVVESPREGYRSCTEYFKTWIVRAGQTWPTQRSRNTILAPSDWIGGCVAPNVELVERLHLFTLALNRLLETQLSLHAYRVDHGRYPSTLTELSPSYLSTVPLDPFSNGQKLRYRLTGKSYLLYSIGPDAVDNGGKPIDDPDSIYARHEVLLHAYEEQNWSKENGDIVAGVNR